MTGTGASHLHNGNIDIDRVALHELGHAIGMSHSNDEDAIMFHQIHPAPAELSGDDIVGVQSLY
jgi:hypothetical protein